MTAASGWYPDPNNATVEWYWDGNAYTEQRPKQPAVDRSVLGPKLGELRGVNGNQAPASGGVKGFAKGMFDRGVGAVVSNAKGGFVGGIVAASVGAPPLEVFRDALVCGNDVYKIDRWTVAEVVDDEARSARTTETKIGKSASRSAGLGVGGGKVTASGGIIGAGVNFGKTKVGSSKNTSVERSVQALEVQFRSTDWGLSYRLVAGQGPEAHRLVEQVNQIVERMQGDSEVKAAQINALSGPDLVSNLERIANLRFQGLITDDEYEAMKAKLLGDA